WWRADPPSQPIQKKNGKPHWKEHQSQRCQNRPEQTAGANRLATLCPFPLPDLSRVWPRREKLPGIRRASGQFQTHSTRCHLSASRKTERLHKSPDGEKPPADESRRCLRRSIVLPE